METRGRVGSSNLYFNLLTGTSPQEGSGALRTCTPLQLTRVGVSARDRSNAHFFLGQEVGATYMHLLQTSKLMWTGQEGRDGTSFVVTPLSILPSLPLHSSPALAKAKEKLEAFNSCFFPLNTPTPIFFQDSPQQQTRTKINKFKLLWDFLLHGAQEILPVTPIELGSPWTSASSKPIGLPLHGQLKGGGS